MKTLKVIGISAATTMSLLLNGCSTPQPSFGPTLGLNQIKVAESVERMELYSRPDGMSLSARDQQAVAQFINGFARAGDGPMFMNIPQQYASSAGVMQTQALVNQMMGQMGAAGRPVQMGSYQANSPAAAPVVLSYRQLRTVTDDCRRMGNLMQTYNNQPYDGFGCAYTSNIAAMINEPGQLLEPYAFSSSDASRRMVIYDKYIEGEVTAAEFPERQDISAED